MKSKKPAKIAKQFWKRPKQRLDLISRGRKYLASIQLENYSANTIERKEIYLRLFIRWCHSREIIMPQDITRRTIDAYQNYLAQKKSANSDNLLSSSYRKNHLLALGMFFRWLKKHKHIPDNPCQDIDIPKIPKRLPHQLLSAKEVEIVLRQPNINDRLGIRDRAILETLYSTGIRRQEIAQLQLNSIDYEGQTLMVRSGKYNKDRLVPIGKRALQWIELYLTQSRPFLRPEIDETTLFLAKHGAVMQLKSFAHIVGKYIQAAKINKNGGCHIFRHTMATLMLENGADIRYLKEILGHSQLETTEIYTKVSINKLKEIHNLTHPARMLPTKTSEILQDLR